MSSVRYMSSKRAHTHSVRPIIHLQSNTSKGSKKKQACTKFCIEKVLQT